MPGENPKLVVITGISLRMQPGCVSSGPVAGFAGASGRIHHKTVAGVGQSGYEFSFLSMSGCRIVGRRKFLSRL
jgi:hypothetical protein